MHQKRATSCTPEGKSPNCALSEARLTSIISGAEPASTANDSTQAVTISLERFLANPTKRLAARIARRVVGPRLHAKVKAASQRRSVIREAGALTAFLREIGCHFHRCSSLLNNPVPLGIAYRYDIHVRDIPGARLLAEFHRAQNVPATFFLFWDYSPFERQRFEDYRELGRLISEPLEIGLHDSPIDAFLIRAEFDGNRREYGKWTDSDDALKWLADLTADSQKQAGLNQAALEDFVGRVRQTRAHFGPFSLVAAHGGELVQSLRKKLPSLSPGAQRTVEGLRARHWLTPERVAAAGLDRCVDHNQYSPPGWCEVSEDGGQLSKMARVLRQRLLTEKTAVQFLLHPYTWAGGKRDAELSELLSLDKANPSIALQS